MALSPSYFIYHISLLGIIAHITLFVNTDAKRIRERTAAMQHQKEAGIPGCFLANRYARYKLSVFSVVDFHISSDLEQAKHSDGGIIIERFRALHGFGESHGSVDGGKKRFYAEAVNILRSLAD